MEHHYSLRHTSQQYFWCLLSVMVRFIVGMQFLWSFKVYIQGGVNLDSNVAYFLKKYSQIEEHSPIVSEVVGRYSANIRYTGEVFQRACTYYDILIWMLWSDYRVIDDM